MIDWLEEKGFNDALSSRWRFLPPGLTFASVDSPDDLEQDFSPVRRWFLPALLLAVAIHGAFLAASRVIPLESISPSYYDRLVPRTFQVKKAEIDPAVLAETDAAPAATPRAKPVPLDQVPAATSKERSFEDMLARADSVVAAPEAAKKDLMPDADKPAPAPSADNALARALTEPPKPALPANDPGSLLDQLDRKVPVAGRPLLEMPAGAPGAGGGASSDAESAAPGQGNFSSLEGLLAGGGAVGDRTKPILLPTDLLFDYNSADLRPAAQDSLRKLGELILRNPNADFTIEGHTDSFGGVAYNQTLSARRAESVKAWLVAAMQIPADRIATRGFGSTKLLAPPTGTVEQQGLNRRVEIVIRQKRR